MIKKKAKFYILILIIFSILAMPLFVFAQSTVIEGIDIIKEPLGMGTKDVRETISSLINQAVGLLGIVAVIIIIVAGLRWMISGGDEEKTKKAKDSLVAGLIGLIIILTSFSITHFVLGSILNAT